MEKFKKAYIYLQSEIINIDKKIQSKFEQLGEEGAQLYALISTYYNQYKRFKINLNCYKLSRELKEKELNRQENTWEILCEVLDKYLSENDAKETKELYQNMVSKEIDCEILKGKKFFKKHKILKEVELKENSELVL